MVGQTQAQTQTPIGGNLEARFGLTSLRSHVSRSLNSGVLAVTELVSDVPMDGPTARMPYDDAFMIGLQIASSDHEMWFDSRATPSPNFAPGETCFYDLRRDPLVYIRGPYHSLQFYMPRVALDEMAAERGRTIDDLEYRLGEPLRDPVLQHLGAAIAPAFRRSGAASGLFLDHVLHAVAAHIAHRYGHLIPLPGPSGLAPWQVRRAKEMIRERLHQRVTLSELAQACGLSVSHFARAFRLSTGVTPHRWLTHCRVERAQDLMLSRGLPLSQIALACGFADQSHFTRVFSQVVGVSPSAWTRARGVASNDRQNRQETRR